MPWLVIVVALGWATLALPIWADRTRMTFTNTVLNAPIDPRAWEVAPDGR